MRILRCISQKPSQKSSHSEKLINPIVTKASFNKAANNTKAYMLHKTN